ncbi:MAG: hypothetical protein H7346_06530 [Burkholderiaceae bacterium]|nr:hypothetical protein [Burkholderiaceae bacterium]
MPAAIPAEGGALAHAQALRERIVQGFAALPVPAEDALLNTLAATDPAGSRRLQSALAGRHWQSLPREWLKANWSSWCYLSAAGYRFYLPALLDAALAGFKGDAAFADTMAYLLNPSYWRLLNEGQDSVLAQQQSLFDASQYETVVLFLDFMFRHGGRPARANMALRHGWRHYLALPAIGTAVRWQREQVNWACPAPEPDLQPLVRQIETAFAHATCPPLSALCGSSAGDEPAELAIELSGLAWQTIAPSWLDQNSAALSFLTARGLCHFLPAFMRGDAMGLLQTDGPLFHLTHSGVIPLEERFECLSVAQCNATIAYLEFARAREADFNDLATESIDEAMERYWRPRLALT